MVTAQVIYRYPIVGKIIFRQPKNDPQMDTTIIIENLVHADGNALNNSELHRYNIFQIFYKQKPLYIYMSIPSNLILNI